MPTKKPKTVTDVRSLARQYTETAIRTLVSIASSEKAQASARVAASSTLLDRGWGKATQPISGDENGPALVIKVVQFDGDSATE